MPGPDPSRILLIRPSALGDVCRTAPVLVSLRRRFPGARIDWLVRDTFEDAVRAHPDLAGVLPFPRRAVQRWWTPTGARSLATFLQAIATPRYDLVLDCQGLFRSAVFSMASGASTRIGDRHAAEGAWLAYSNAIRTDRTTHVVDRMLSLAAAADAPAIPDMRLFTPPDIESPKVELETHRFAVLAPTSAWRAKCWPSKRFAALAEALLGECLVERIAVMGGANERDQAPELVDLAARDNRVVDLIGRTSVGQMMRVIERSALVVANDSAAMHMAVGFNRPLVALLGPTDPALAGPYGRPECVAQVVTPEDRLTHRACKDAAYGTTLMRRISVDLALTRATEQLGRIEGGVTASFKTARAGTAAQ